MYKKQLQWISDDNEFLSLVYYNKNDKTTKNDNERQQIGTGKKVYKSVCYVVHKDINK